MALESPVAHRRDRPGHLLQYNIRLAISANGLRGTRRDRLQLVCLLQVC